MRDYAVSTPRRPEAPAVQDCLPPPWLRYFLVHVVKRCCGILLRWIEEVEAEANRY